MAFYEWRCDGDANRLTTGTSGKSGIHSVMRAEWKTVKDMEQSATAGQQDS